MTSLLKEKFKTRLSAKMLLNKLICSFCGFYDGQINKVVLSADNQLTLMPLTHGEPTPKILIVSRQFYSEKVKGYPIENKKELNKFLQLEYAGPEYSYYVWGTTEGNSQVNIWTFTKNLPAAFILLPESLLYALSVTKKQTNATSQVIKVTTEQELYVCRHHGAVYSSLKSSMINSVQRFAISAGLPLNNQEHDIMPVQRIGLFAKALQKVPLALWSKFIRNTSQGANKLLLIKKAALPFFAVFSTYILLSSLYLVIKTNNLQATLTSQSAQINVALNQQQELDNNISRYNALKDFVSQQHIVSPIWLVVAELAPTVKLSSMSFNKGRYIIKGTSDKATATLELISNMSNVVEATFDRPSSKYRGKDRFTIGFGLQHHSLGLYVKSVKKNDDVTIEQNTIKAVSIKEANNG